MSDLQGTRVLFVLDAGPPFSGRDYRRSGVGGTQACVVLLGEALAARGATVVVANRLTAPVIDAGVHYVPLSAIGANAFDLVVLWKHWSDEAANRGRTRLFVWTDVHTPDPGNLARCRTWADATLTLSDFQRRRLEAVTGTNEIETLGAPIDEADYAEAPASKEKILLYCSVPDRGLYYLKDLFPKIRQRVPEARLVITSDFTLWGARPAKEAFAKFFEDRAGVEYAGHVPRAELVALQQRARVMAYPCTFEEGFCLAAAECMAAGAVPVTTNAYALVTTVGDGGVLINGRPRSWFYRRRFVRACVELLTNDARWNALMVRGRARALNEYAPGRIADKLLDAAVRARQRKAH